MWFCGSVVQGVVLWFRGQSGKKASSKAEQWSHEVEVEVEVQGLKCTPEQWSHVDLWICGFVDLEPNLGQKGEKSSLLR